MKKLKYLLLVLLLSIPYGVCAATESMSLDNIFTGLMIALAFHVFIFRTYANAFVEKHPKLWAWSATIIRALLLYSLGLFGSGSLLFIEILCIFVVSTLIYFVAASKGIKFDNNGNVISRLTPTDRNTNTTSVEPTKDKIELKCSKCGAVLNVNDDKCSNCGEPFSGDNVVVSTSTDSLVKLGDFDTMYALNEKKLLDEYLKKEMEQAGYTNDLIPENLIKRKMILNIFYSVILFAYISSIFFHFPLATYIVGGIIILLIIFFTFSYDITTYLKKEITARPNEKIKNIVMNTKNTLVIDDRKHIRIAILLLAFVLPLVVFYKPRILYEKTDGGYAVRYYIYGLSNFETAEIPSTYKNQPVVSLRGNTFSNMKHLKSVKLPSTIKEIRGQAFKNDVRLKYVELPSELEYLGGGAFYNCKSLESIVLPDTLKYLGGESFYGCSSLYSVNIPSSLTEIRGDTFEYCTSLIKIEIPDSITRIGGHAFYGDSSLQEVKIGKYSKLKEIGSSAFRQCNSLKTITLPKTTLVNERAFKESPTKVNYYEY